MLELHAVWSPEAQQRVFRGLLMAQSYPGRAADLASECGGADAVLALLSTIVDKTQLLADPDGLLDERDVALLGPANGGAVRGTDPARADVAVFNASRPPAPGFEPRLGTLSRPELGQTMVLKVESLAGPAGAALRISGPGVDGEIASPVRGLDAGWMAARDRWTADFPLGCDIFLVDGASAIALPRTARVGLDAVERGAGPGFRHTLTPVPAGRGGP